MPPLSTIFQLYRVGHAVYNGGGNRSTQATVSLKVVRRKRRRKCTLKSYDRFTNTVVRIYDLRQKVIAKLRVVKGTRKS